MITVNPEERPRDQEWIHVAEFERDLYDRNAPAPAPVRRLTTGPTFHWFGYYDKLETDPKDRYVLGMEVDFEGRSVRPGDSIGIGAVDLAEDCLWKPLGSTTAWGWQQGCMLQWLPGSDSRIIHNIHHEGDLAARILDIHTGEDRVIPRPVYHVHPEGRRALSLDFSRIQRLRPGYGYWVDNGDDVGEAVPDDNGVWLVDLDTGVDELIVKISQAVAIPYPEPNETDVHYFNHAQWSPSGRRFLFLHRWRSASGRFEGFRTRLLTASADGRDLRVVCPEGQISHFVWQDENTINVWIDGAFWLYTDADEPRPELLWEATNGHQSYLSGSAVLVADTYADGEGFQNLYIYRRATRRPLRIGRFYLPSGFVGEWRCDLHPRISRDKTRLFVDSAHEGIGRQIYEISLPPGAAEQDE